MAGNRGGDVGRLRVQAGADRDGRGGSAGGGDASLDAVPRADGHALCAGGGSVKTPSGEDRGGAGAAEISLHAFERHGGDGGR